MRIVLISLLIVLILSVEGCEQRANIEEQKKFEYHLAVIDSSFTYTVNVNNYYTAIEFLEKKTGIKAKDYNQSLIGTFIEVTRGDYSNWKEWYESNKDSLLNDPPSPSK